MKNKILLFVCTGGVILCYILAISAYTRLSSDPIIFFASLAIALFLSVLSAVLLLQLGRKNRLFDGFTAVLSSLVYFFGLVVFITFGPVFIDRSISYHLAFYAAEKERIEIEAIREEFSSEIFEKRIHDAITTGFLLPNDDGTYSPSSKAKLMTAVLLPLGRMTNSSGTYENMKEELEK